jgi:hypothetical protein
VKAVDPGSFSASHDRYKEKAVRTLHEQDSWAASGTRRRARRPRIIRKKLDCRSRHRLDQELPMAVFRFLAAVFLLAATVALVVDATPAIYGAGSFNLSALSNDWMELAPKSFDATKSAVSGITPWLWDDVIAPILTIPTFIAFGALALLSGYAGRRRKTVRIFVN